MCKLAVFARARSVQERARRLISLHCCYFALFVCSNDPIPKSPTDVLAIKGLNKSLINVVVGEAVQQH